MRLLLLLTVCGYFLFAEGQDDSQRLLELLQNLAAGSKKERLFQDYEQEERAFPDSDPLEERQQENEALRELQAVIENPEALRVIEDFQLMDEDSRNEESAQQIGTRKEKELGEVAAQPKPPRSTANLQWWQKVIRKADSVCTDFGIFADKVHCRKYMQCLGPKQGFTLTCKKGTMFDALLRSCQPESTVDCSIQ